jgi:hypothetical protein
MKRSYKCHEKCAVHYSINWASHRAVPVCGNRNFIRLSDDPEAVTCKMCMKKQAYKQAAEKKEGER